MKSIKFPVHVFATVCVGTYWMCIWNLYLYIICLTVFESCEYFQLNWCYMIGNWQGEIDVHTIRNGEKTTISVFWSTKWKQHIFHCCIWCIYLFVSFLFFLFFVHFDYANIASISKLIILCIHDDSIDQKLILIVYHSSEIFKMRKKKKKIITHVIIRYIQLARFHFSVRPLFIDMCLHSQFSVGWWTVFDLKQWLSAIVRVFVCAHTHTLPLSFAVISHCLMFIWNDTEREQCAMLSWLLLKLNNC